MDNNAKWARALVASKLYLRAAEDINNAAYLLVEGELPVSLACAEAARCLLQAYREAREHAVELMRLSESE